MRVALNQVHELADRGHKTELLCGWREPGPPPATVDGVAVRGFRAFKCVPRGKFSGLYSFGLQRWLKQNLRPEDVLHVHGGRDLVTVSALAIGAAVGCSVVIQTHGMIKADRRIRALLFDSLILRRLVLGVQRHLVLTDQEKEELREAMNSRLQICLIGSGMALGAYRDEPISSGDGPEVIYCSRLHKRKRPVDFVNTAGLVRNKSAHFTLIGPDEGELAAVQKRISELALEGRVKYGGSLAYDKVLDRLVEASVYVFPSVDEPFGLSLLEAMSAGLACVCTESTGISGKLRDAQAAIVTDGSVKQMADAVDLLLDDADLRRDIGARARIVVRDEYSIGAVVNRLEIVYKSACEERARRGAARTV